MTEVTSLSVSRGIGTRDMGSNGLKQQQQQQHIGCVCDEKGSNDVCCGGNETLVILFFIAQ